MTDRFGRTLPKHDADRRLLLELADRLIAEPFEPNDPMANLRGREIQAVVAHFGGGSSLGRALMVRLDARTCTVVFPAMMHLGSTVTLTLPLLRGGTQDYAALVEDCRHLAGHMHVNRLVFREGLDLGLLTPRAKLVMAEASTTEVPSVLCGRCLVLGASTLESQVLLHFFCGTNTDVRSVEHVGQIFDLAAISDVDAIIIDQASLGPAPDEMLAKMRGLGLRGGIAVLISGSADPADSDDDSLRVIRLSRPIVKDTLMQGMAILLRGLTAEDTRNVVSTLADEATLPMVQEFLRLVQEQIQILARISNATGFQEARSIVVEWRDFGSTFGFAPLSEAAAKTVQAMDASCSLDESARDLRALLSVARRLRAPGFDAAMVEAATLHAKAA